MNNNLYVLLSLPKSILFNIKIFPLKYAIKLPVFVSYNTKTKGLRKNAIKLEFKPKLFSIKFGYGGTDGVISNKHSEIVIGNNGNLFFYGNAHFAEGCSVRCDGEMHINKDFSANKNTFVSCGYKIIIGSDVMVGWNCHIRDDDGHTVFHNGNPKPSKKQVEIGDHVWICSETRMLKGTKIASNSITAWGAVVTDEFSKSNVILGGFPAKVIQENVDWKHEII